MLTKPRSFGRFVAFSVLALLCACSAPFTYDAPQFAFSDRFPRQDAGSPVLLEDSAWWRDFKDPVLDALVDAALVSSLNLELARERVVAARALARASSQGLNITGSLRAERRGGSDRDITSGVDGTFGMTWLFDPWGGRAAERAAAQARAQAADAERDAAQLLLLSNLATTYVELRFAEASLRIRRQELRNRQRTLELVRQLITADAATQLELVQAQAQLAQAQALIPPLKADVISATSEIAVLLGKAPGATELPPGRVARQPVAGLTPDVGIPADLLRNRPDIRINERLYYAAVADIGDARADLYPSLSLSGTLSLSVFNGVEQNAYSLGPSLTLPALPNGPRRATVELRESQARQAHTTWTASVIGAIGEVERALGQYDAAGASVQAAKRTVQLRNRSLSLTRELVVNRRSTIRQLLEAEDDVLDARIRVAEALRSQARSYVTLHTALGAGNRYGGGTD